MSQIFTIHSIEKCEFCKEIKAEVGVNQYRCINCGNTEDNF